jgi:NAD(P)-dependent dehydrogenase (short-subunit alcohol dehydrogenase family)
MGNSYTPFAALAGQVAIITGGAQGIGAGIAKRFAQMGLRVVILDIADREGQATAHALAQEGGDVRYIHCDVSSSSAIADAVAAVAASHRRIDVMVNNAYWSIVKDVMRLPEDEWDRGMAVMLKSAYLFGKHVIPHMLNRGGSIVNIASVHALATVPRYPVYAAAKAGLLHLTRQMAIDGAPHKIRVNAICPGAIQNRPNQTLSVDKRQHIPARRLGQPEEIANAALFLVSDMATYVNGHALVVDGGMSTQLGDVANWSGGKLAFTDEADI